MGMAAGNSSAAVGQATTRAVVASITAVVVIDSAFAAIQMLVPDAMRGRVMAIVNVAVFGSMAISPVLTGFLAKGIHTRSINIDPGEGVQIGVGTLGVILTLAALVMLIWRTPEVDGLKPGDPEWPEQAYNGDYIADIAADFLARKTVGQDHPIACHERSRSFIAA